MPEWPRHLTVFEINIWVWLSELSQNVSRNLAKAPAFRRLGNEPRIAGLAPRCCRENRDRCIGNPFFVQGEDDDKPANYPDSPNVV
jgi:hypothetical protein